MKIFETHAHYDDERFDEDRDELISSMLSDTGELDYIVNVGASRQGCEASLALLHNMKRYTQRLVSTRRILCD